MANSGTHPSSMLNTDSLIAASITCALEKDAVSGAQYAATLREAAITNRYHAVHTMVGSSTAIPRSGRKGHGGGGGPSPPSPSNSASLPTQADSMWTLPLHAPCGTTTAHTKEERQSRRPPCCQTEKAPGLRERTPGPGPDCYFAAGAAAP